MSNMKTKIIPFNKELAEKIQAGEIEGRIIVKETGNNARIICTDLKGREYPILFLENKDGIEVTGVCSTRGFIGPYEILVLEVPDEYHGKYIYEFDEDPKKLLHTSMVEKIATKVTIDGFVTRNRYGNTDYDKQTFKPFDKVMVTQKGWNYWIPNIYRNQTPDGKHICIDNLEYDLCKPYEEND